MASSSFTAKNSDMEFRFLGNTGLLVSALSFGAWLTFQGTDEKAVEENAYRMMKTAIKNGANFFDNAETYGDGQAEVIMGRVLKRLFAEGVVKRQHLVITTKIYWGDESVPNMHGLSRKHIMEAMNSSLERFQLPYVDVVFAHRPDKYTPLEETVRAFSDLITQGKAFYWGTSEWPADMWTEAYHIAKRLNLHAPVAEQPQYSMLCRQRVENEYERLINTEARMGLTVWSPLASGLLSGKYTSLAEEELPADSRLGSNAMVRGFIFKKDNSVSCEVRDRAHLEQIIAGLRLIAERLGATLPQLALAWLLKNKGVSTVITGASKPEQIEENFKAIGVYRKLTDADMEEIEKLLGNNPRNNPMKMFWQSARHAWSPMVFPAKPVQ